MKLWEENLKRILIHKKVRNLNEDYKFEIKRNNEFIKFHI
jgi:hypothetical protein